MEETTWLKRQAMPARAGRNHAREELARAENRINVILYAAQGIPQFWAECRTILGLAPDAYLRRVILEGRPERPDFLVYEGGVATRWIESELADRDDAQLGNYAKKKLGPPGVISLVGPAVNREGDPSLEWIAEAALGVAKKIEAENKPGAEVLEPGRPHTGARAASKAASRAACRPRALDAGSVVLRGRWPTPGADGRRDRGEQAGPPRLAFPSASADPEPGRKPLAVQPASQGDFEFPAPDVLEEHLADPLRSAVLPAWRALLDSAVPGWPTRINGRQRVVVPAARVQANAAGFAGAFAEFRDCLSPPSQTSGSQPTP
jgi:hypothetical protein